VLKPIVKRFRINGLHGYKNVEIKFTHPARVIIAENGAGKTTILAALYAFLKMDLYRLAKIKFETIECEIEGHDGILRINKNELQEFEAKSLSDSEFEKLARFSSNGLSSIREAVLQVDPDNLMSFVGIPILNDIYMASPYDHQEFFEILSSVLDSVAEMPGQFADIESILKSLIGNYHLLYLPTYRRVELPNPKLQRRNQMGRRFREPDNTDGIRYGLRDVQDRLAEILSEIQRYSNNQYRTISAAIIDDALAGKINSDSNEFMELPDIDDLRLFFSRVDSDQSKSSRLESLKHLYTTDQIKSKDNLFFRYFLSKLGAVVDRTKQQESSVETFVEKVNVYLKLSGDEKILTYDSNIMRVVVKNTFNNDEIDLESLSSGEKQVISLFSHLYLESGQKIVLIDEPELSLSIDWQKRLLPDVVSSPGCAQLLAITHSPFIFDNDLDKYAGPMRIWRE